MMSHNASITHNWIARIQPKPQAGLRLFCFPYAGGGTSTFQPWSRLLPPEIELCPVKLPGREGRLNETPYHQLQPLVETLVEVLQPFFDKPFAFFGHSLGALVSFELARQLRRQGLPAPSYLFVSGSNAPHWPDPTPPLHQLPDAIFVDRLRHRYDGIPAAIWQDAELMQLFLPALRADFEMLETYVYLDESPLAIPVAIFGGQEDDQTTQAGLAAWREQAQQTFYLKMFSGGHFFLQNARMALIQTLIADLNRFLNRPRGI